jgi:hypothetical protein
MTYPNAIHHHALPFEVSNLLRRPLLNLNISTGCQVCIEGGGGGSYEEGDAVVCS